MLARTIAWVGVTVALWFDVTAGELKPNVFVLVQDAGPQRYFESMSAVADAALWRSESGSFRNSPGRAASLAAVMFGKSPLQCGVVSDHDWRRVPVAGPNLATWFKEAGYRTAFCGAGGKEYPDFEKRSYFEYGDRETLIDPWVASTGKIRTGFMPDAFLGGLLAEEAKPLFCVIGQGRLLNEKHCADLFQTKVVPLMKSSKRPAAIIILKLNTGPNNYHNPASWYFYHYGKKEAFDHTSKALNQCKTDGEIHHGIKSLLGEEKVLAPGYRFFHKANWPANESPEKFRHRGSLIVGKGHALVDGLELYPVTKNLEPDLTKPLDIAENQKLHSELLTQHAKWWQQARVALHDQRSFEVGKEGQASTRLTALDWRPSKIIHPDETSPSFQPLVYQQDLIAMLKGLREEKYRELFPAYSGSWSVNITRPGRYKITASLIPKEATDPEHETLAKFQAGRAFVRLGRNQVELNLLKGATAISIQMDSDAGVADLECWFIGQLSLERELGAFFVQIERVGDKKFDFKPKSSTGKSPAE